MKQSLYFLFLLLTLAACQTEVKLPENSTPTADSATIYPDYTEIVIPPNIAPLNIQVTSPGNSFACSITGNGKEIITAAGKDGKLKFDVDQWHTLLEANKGQLLQVTIYSLVNDNWLQHPSYNIKVAEEPIDQYLSYRLIEPSYELFRQMGIYQRDLTDFNESPIYENNRSYEKENNHCVNCHNFQNYSTDRMLMHVRAQHGGTLFFNGDKVQKMNMKCDSILSSTVYPTWHPRRNWVVFSSNRTGQAFHMVNHEKIEVLDYGSDLVFFDVDHSTLTNVLKTKEKMETFPNWAPDGKKLFFCSADFPLLAQAPDSVHSDLVLAKYDSIRYNLMSITFDEQTKTFGTPVTELRCDSMHRSATWPRVSPDGRYVLFTMADYGQFHIWHRSSDLYVKDLATGEVRPLTAANSDNIDSNHNWSSNGRWIVVSSRRGDGSFSRVYIAYFDKEGQAHKAFLLPQEDPEHNVLRLKSYNIPELTKNAVQVSPEKIKEAIYNDNNIPKVEYSTTIR